MPQAKVIIFGHTHRIVNKKLDSVLYFNSGSAAISALPPFNGFISEWMTLQAVFYLADALPGMGGRLLGALLFVLLCMIVRWVFALLVRLLRGVNLIPLVGGANRLLGLVLGLVTGAFDCWLLAMLLWFAASITTGQIDWLTTGVLQRSVGYSLFGAFNPFLLHY